MPLGFTSSYLLQVGNTAFDLRHVDTVSDHPTDPDSILVTLVGSPTQPVRLPRAAFESAYELALLAQATAGSGGGGGGGGGSGARFTFTQSTPDATWTIFHNLGFHPQVRIVDSGGTTVFGNVEDVNASLLTITFGSPFSGTAYLS